MTVLIATNAGALLALNVADDDAGDRLVALGRHLGAPSSWTSSAGAIVAMRDGAEAWEFDVEITGSFSGVIELLAPGPRTMAVSRALVLAAGAKAKVLFRVTKTSTKDEALAGPVPAVDPVKFGSCSMSCTATMTPGAVIDAVSSSAMTGSATMSASGEVS